MYKMCISSPRKGGKNTKLLLETATSKLHLQIEWNFFFRLLDSGLNGPQVRFTIC